MRAPWRWDFWRRDETRGRGASVRRSAPDAPRHVDDWEALLVEEGVGVEWAVPLSKCLLTLHRELGHDAVEPLLRGAVATVEIQAEAQAHVERNMRDVREVERLLGAFSGELEKLDEVLEVLAAYAQRMRAQPGRKPSRTLH